MGSWYRVSIGRPPESARVASQRRSAQRRGFPGERGKRRGRCSRLEEIPEGMDLPAGFIWALYVDLSPLGGRRWPRERGTEGEKEREGWFGGKIEEDTRVVLYVG